MTIRSVRERLEAMFAVGLEAVNGARVVERAIRRQDGRLRIAGHEVAEGAGLQAVAIGKAAVPMVRAFQGAVGERLRGGLVVTTEGHAPPASLRLPIREAAHPIPDERCEAAAREILHRVGSAPESDLLVVLLSGGASALCSCPAEGLSLADLAATTSALLACGADIAETNAVRKHLSAFSGGRLAAAARARRVLVLALSDVPGDALDVIGSGPCIGDPSRFGDALRVVERHGLRSQLPDSVVAYLEAGAAGDRPESPKPGDATLERVDHCVLARNADAREAVVAAARATGARTIDLGEVLAGEASEMGRQLVARARGVRSQAPVVLVAGGETVVSVRGPGRGGRNQELALAAALELVDADSGITLLAAGTDGRDGPTDAAGACVDAGTLARGRAVGVDARACLEHNDSYGFFSREGGLVRTGPTETNVMDLVLIAVDGGNDHSPGGAVLESSPP